MTKLQKTLIAAAAAAALAVNATPALAEVAPPDTSPVCTSINATVYFADDQTDLSDASLAALKAQTEQHEGCVVSTIEATTISTDGGTELSEARSDAVLSALSDIGIATADTVATFTSQPQEGKLLLTARRVDVTLSTRPDVVNS